MSRKKDIMLTTEQVEADYQSLLRQARERMSSPRAATSPLPPPPGDAPHGDEPSDPKPARRVTPSK